MKITEEKIRQLAHLARLEFNGDETASIKQDLENILNLCEKLNEVNTDETEPLIYMTSVSNNVREDEAFQEFDRDELLKNAPKKDSDYFRVPKVIEQNK